MKSIIRLWTEREIELLRKYYPLVGESVTEEELCSLLNRTYESIRTKTRQLGLKRRCLQENINLEILKDLEKRFEI